MLRIICMLLMCIFISACSTNHDYLSHNQKIISKLMKPVLEVEVERSGNVFTAKMDGVVYDYIKVNDSYHFLTDQIFGSDKYKSYIFIRFIPSSALAIKDNFGIFSYQDTAMALPKRYTDETGEYICIRKKEINNKMDLAMYIKKSSKREDEILSIFKYHDATAIGWHNIDIRLLDSIPYNTDSSQLMSESELTNNILDGIEKRAIQAFTILPKN